MWRQVAGGEEGKAPQGDTRRGPIPNPKPQILKDPDPERPTSNGSNANGSKGKGAMVAGCEPVELG